MVYLYSVVIIIAVLIFLFFALAKIAKMYDEKKTEKHVLAFIKNNPDKASMYVYVNGKTIVDYGAERKMPLASTVKIMIAIEYAKQVASKKVEPHTMVSLHEIDRYYIPNRDGGAHPNWLKSLHIEQVTPDSFIPLQEIVRGMIAYSSNANTEYLIDYLGLERINKTIQELHLNFHDPLFPISSAMLISSYLNDKQKRSRKQLHQYIQQMSSKEYSLHACDIHNLLKNDLSKELVTNFTRSSSFDRKLQQIKSSKLPSSTAKDYATLLKRIHQDDELFTAPIRDTIRSIMDRPLAPHSKFAYLGSKGGSTISILNEALYSKDLEGNTLDMALFIDDPSGLDNMWLRHKIDLFLHKFLVDLTFRQKVLDTLTS
ncbi:serine hydrolase [Paenibacillus sp. 481]|uniref:serine hydrolase n=1 Tax=Paenibacillus sp. 481 TaxID=2835869 RepID=UPI001E2D72A6|nr:serine hydrolase [Paenibacillus sp. 481]UHA74210.1 serine hydrolase [Paenibacillus sp. 481]